MTPKCCIRRQIKKQRNVPYQHVGQDTPPTPSPRRARTAVTRFGMRKIYRFSDTSKVPKKKAKTSTDDNKRNKTDKKRKDYHKHCYCPVPGCTSLVKRIPPHYKKCAQIGSHISEVQRLVSKCVRPYHERPRIAQRKESSPSLTSESSLHEVVTIGEDEEDQQDQSDLEVGQVESSDIDAPEFTFQSEAKPG